LERRQGSGTQKGRVEGRSRVFATTTPAGDPHGASRIPAVANTNGLLWVSNTDSDETEWAGPALCTS
jgi:hypothetical protein